ncbi:MAG: hypothetical protein U0Y82_03295 [Thermoleophilia bacterium]
MNNLHLALNGSWRVLLWGLLFGAGVPLMFALGIRAYATGSGGDATADHAPARPLGKALAGLCLLLVVGGVALGLTAIVASGMGKKLSFDSGYPTVVAKKK